MSDQSPPPPPARTEPLAIWSLALAIVSWLGCFIFAAVPAIICGHLARSKIRRSSGTLKGMEVALASLIVAYLQIPFLVLGGAMLIDMIRSDRARLHDLAIEKKEVTSDDGHLKIITSGFWVKRTDLNKRAALQAGYKDKDMYVMVISDPKNTVSKMTLQQEHEATRDHLSKQLTNSSATEPVSLTVDGHPALQDEISGSNQGKDIVFLHTSVEEDDSFQQILAWTMKWRWGKQNAELRDVTNSFHSEK
jgi:uncharacterized protein DUF4190